MPSVAAELAALLHQSAGGLCCFTVSCKNSGLCAPSAVAHGCCSTMSRYQTDLPDGVGEMNDRLVAEAEAGEYPPGVQVRGQAEHGSGPQCCHWEFCTVKRQADRLVVVCWRPRLFGVRSVPGCQGLTCRLLEGNWCWPGRLACTAWLRARLSCMHSMAATCTHSMAASLL